MSLVEGDIGRLVVALKTDDDRAAEDAVVKRIDSPCCCVLTEVKALLLVESSPSFNDVVITILEKVVAGVFTIDNVLSVIMVVSSARLLVTTTIKTKKGK